jgi:hypothetical protein
MKTILHFSNLNLSFHLTNLQIYLQLTESFFWHMHFTIVPILVVFEFKRSKDSYCSLYIFFLCKYFFYSVSISSWLLSIAFLWQYFESSCQTLATSVFLALIYVGDLFLLDFTCSWFLLFVSWTLIVSCDEMPVFVLILFYVCIFGVWVECWCSFLSLCLALWIVCMVHGLIWSIGCP